MSELAATERALMTALGTIRDNWDALVEPSSGGASGGGAKSSDSITGIDRTVSLRHETTLCLNGWARIVVDDRELTHNLPLRTDTIGLIEFLERWARWFSGHEAAEDAAEEIGGYANQVRNAAAPARRDWIALGSCPIEVEIDAELSVCGGSVRAYPNRDPQCQRCGTEAAASWWERVMFPDAETSTLLLEAEIATFVHRAFGGSPVKPSTVRQWVKRGVIVSSGTDDKGRKLYSRDAVVYAIATRDLHAIGQTDR